jgi:methylase of polypeptide subunit release factors
LEVILALEVWMGLIWDLKEKKWEWLEARAYTGIIGDFDPPSFFAEVMAETIPIRANATRLLDIGCGTGIIGIYSLVKKRARFVTFNDCLSDAIAVTFANVQWHIEQGNIEESRVGCLKSDFAAISAEAASQHDLIAFNPPQLPWKWVDEDYRKEIGLQHSQMSFRFGGEDGLDAVRNFLGWYGGLGSKRPPALITLSSFLSKSSITAALNSCGVKWRVFYEKKNVPLREILAQAAESFGTDGKADRCLEKTPKGNWTKELLVVSLGDCE